MSIYVFRVGDLAKIGNTGNVEERLRQIQRRQAGTLYPPNLGDESATIAAVLQPHHDYERALHDAFHDLHVHGEWYRWEERLARWCDRRRPYLGPVDPSQPVDF